MEIEYSFRSLSLHYPGGDRLPLLQHCLGISNQGYPYYHVQLVKFASSIYLVIGSIDYNRMGRQLAIIVDIVFIRLLVRHKQHKDTHSLVSS